jgi:hypothetical protein
MGALLHEGASRRADTLLQTSGGRMVYLRMPGLAASGDDSEQLGLATATFQDLPLRPVAFHKADDTNKLLVSANAVMAIVQSLTYDSADVLFKAAVGVLIDDVVYEITDSNASQAMGRPYCYWLTLQRPTR